MRIEPVEFFVGGDVLRGDLYRPEGETRPPVVVMGHGFGAERRFRLPAFAERLCAAGMAAVALLLAGYQQFGLLPHAWALLPAAAGLGLALSRLRTIWREFTPEAIQRGVGLLVLGIIPLDAVLAWAAGPWWGGVLVLALLIPGRLLGRWLYVT
jgi:fermentation-respiration switch protein FrsA (DUF1100 family)